MTDRFVVIADRHGWRVTDSRTGHFHSAAIADRARAEAQAATMNRKLAQIQRGFESTAVRHAEVDAYREDAQRRADAAAAADPFIGLDVRSTDPMEGRNR